MHNLPIVGGSSNVPNTQINCSLTPSVGSVQLPEIKLPETSVFSETSRIPLEAISEIVKADRDFLKKLEEPFKPLTHEDLLEKFGPELTQLMELHTRNVKIVQALKAQGDKVYEKFVEVIMSGKGKKEVLDMLYGPGKEKDSTVNKLLKTLKDNDCTILDFIPLQEK